MPEPEKGHAVLYSAKLLARRLLSDKTFEVELDRPAAFTFLPGQRIRFIHDEMERDYSLVSAADDPSMALCIRRVEGGTFSPLLASVAMGSRFSFTGPHGYFVFHPSGKPAVFVATGTGIAPFVSMSRSGLTGFTLLHGVQDAGDLYYEPLLRSAARQYIPCLSGKSSDRFMPRGSFHGRVTDYLEHSFPAGLYDFYLCGRLEMIRDVTLLVDERFPGSLIHTETFY